MPATLSAGGECVPSRIKAGYELSANTDSWSYHGGGATPSQLGLHTFGVGGRPGRPNAQVACEIGCVRWFVKPVYCRLPLSRAGQ